MSNPVCPEVIEKSWGKTKRVYHNDTHEVWHASINAGGFSSKHCHKRKTNEFYVVSGELVVIVWASPEDAATITIYTLQPGMSLTVEPGLWHRFQALQATQLLEVYYGKAQEHDIVRLDVGGIAKEHDAMLPSDVSPVAENIRSET